MLRHRSTGAGDLVDQGRSSCEGGNLRSKQDRRNRRLDPARRLGREGRQGDVSVFREERLRDGTSDRRVTSRG